MRDWLKSNKKNAIGSLVVVSIIIPIIIYLLSTLPIFPSGGNDWAGFWGGYIGSIIGGLITLFVLFKTLNDNKELQQRDEIMNYLSTLGDLVSDYITMLQDYSKKVRVYSECNANNQSEEMDRLDSAETSYIQAKRLGRQIFTKLRTHTQKVFKGRSEYVEALRNINTICAEVNEIFTNKSTGSFDSLFIEPGRVASEERIKITQDKLDELRKNMLDFEESIVSFISNYL